MLGAVLAINLAVRVLGHGDPFVLSPFFLPEKLRALGLLALHLPSHGEQCEPASIERAIAQAAQRHGISASLTRTVARVESSLRPHVISRTGAMGLMQLMPATARENGADDPFDPSQNADAGARYLRSLLERYTGDRVRALAAYNAGPGRVPVRGAFSVPDETRNYVTRALGPNEIGRSGLMLSGM